MSIHVTVSGNPVNIYHEKNGIVGSKSNQEERDR